MVSKERISVKGLSQFLRDYPGMSTTPCSDTSLRLKGKFCFKAIVAGYEEIEDSYSLEIVIPEKFPQALPKVKETDSKIPRDGSFHVNPDGSLCLGSPLRLLAKVHSDPKLTTFSEKCLIPYLYAVSYKLKFGGDFVFGELPHAEEGILDDYRVLLELRDKHQVKRAINLLGMKKGIANKQPCPCGCGKRLELCSFRHTLNQFRKMAPVSWFKAHASNEWGQL